jgi:hypothetical protein
MEGNNTVGSKVDFAMHDFSLFFYHPLTAKSNRSPFLGPFNLSLCAALVSGL